MPELIRDDDDAESERWDEMLDNGIDFSQDIEFADGTAVRIASSTSVEPASSPTASGAAASAKSPSTETKVLENANTDAEASSAHPAAAKSPTKPASPTWVKPERASISEPQDCGAPKPSLHYSETWGRSSKAAGQSQQSNEDAAKPAASRWWKASLSGGLRVSESAATAKPAPPLSASRHAAGGGKKGNTASSSSSKPLQLKTERNAKSQRGNRRHHQVPIPTVVPPLLLSRAGARNAGSLAAHDEIHEGASSAAEPIEVRPPSDTADAGDVELAESASKDAPTSQAEATLAAIDTLPATPSVIASTSAET
ncbi:hypothetical protein GGI12_005757, partial [Dipsacomyces acuminosporus]